MTAPEQTFGAVDRPRQEEVSAEDTAVLVGHPGLPAFSAQATEAQVGDVPGAPSGRRAAMRRERARQLAEAGYGRRPSGGFFGGEEPSADGDTPGYGTPPAADATPGGYGQGGPEGQPVPYPQEGDGGRGGYGQGGYGPGPEGPAAPYGQDAGDRTTVYRQEPADGAGAPYGRGAEEPPAYEQGRDGAGYEQGREAPAGPYEQDAGGQEGPAGRYGQPPEDRTVVYRPGAEGQPPFAQDQPPFAQDVPPYGQQDAPPYGQQGPDVSPYGNVPDRQDVPPYAELPAAPFQQAAEPDRPAYGQGPEGRYSPEVGDRPADPRPDVPGAGPQAPSGAFAPAPETAGDPATSPRLPGAEEPAPASASQQALAAADDLQRQVGDQVAVQQQRAAAGVRDLARGLGDMAAGRPATGLAPELAQQAADRLHGVADHLERRTPGELLDDVWQLARKRPGVFLAGTALAGFALGRLVKDRPAQAPAPEPAPPAPEPPAAAQPAAQPAPEDAPDPRPPFTNQAYAAGGAGDDEQYFATSNDPAQPGQVEEEPTRQVRDESDPAYGYPRRYGDEGYGGEAYRGYPDQQQYPGPGYERGGYPYQQEQQPYRDQP